MDINKFYRTAFVKRWHTKPECGEQTTGEHTFGMLLLCEFLHPNPSANLLRAIMRHDLHESIFADIPFNVKRMLPAFDDLEKEFQQQFEKVYDLKGIELTVEEKLWLRYLDNLEVLVYLEESVDPNDENEKIYNQSADIVKNLTKQLQVYGYLKNPDNTVH